MYAEIMQVSIAASMMVQTGLMLRNAMRAEQSQNAGAPKVAPELKIESSHAKENTAPSPNAGAAHETNATEPVADDVSQIG